MSEPEYRFQRFRGGWAIAEYRDGERVSRHQLESGDAVAAAEEFRSIVAARERASSPDIATLWAKYRKDREGRVIAGNMEFSGRAILPFFGKMKPAGITTTLCRDYVARRRQMGRQDGTIWTELGHLRTMLRWAEKEKLIDEAPSIERPRQPPPKTRHLTRSQFETLLDAAEMPHIRLFMILAIGTAAREQAILGLTWDRVKFERGRIELHDPEMDQPVKGRAVVPMTASARAALQSAQAGARSPFVIEWAGQRVKKVRKGLDKTAERACKIDPSIGSISPHLFRHSAAVWMAEAGRPMAEIAQYLGHADSRITERVYARFSPDYLREAADALEVGKVRSVPRFA
ncbi:integrase [Ancylobacter sp. 3268]|uniref:tyrosine-type recombinase/integrase n=1 Tax=Ancylobacter sp. 3268 TaxID=2817752 RepID=UPI00285462F1|nr:site-specific integrase [Ancylobacter sp. 3268]MDR6954203.1 integrase [Ancylobacter sp. 3268]